MSTSNTFLYNVAGTPPLLSFHTLSAQLNNGHSFEFSQLKGKKVLIVNTASDCGYTPQYEELQKLHEMGKDFLHIIAFPSNDFKEQEKGDDKAIAAFCEKYRVSFPLAKKTSVVKSSRQHPVYEWLTSKEKNGWNDQEPTWNFSKYLINENGILTHYFEPFVSPLSRLVLQAVTA